MSEIVTIRMTATRAAQVAALERITGLSGVAAVVDFALATTLAQYGREETREMETEDRVQQVGWLRQLAENIAANLSGSPDDTADELVEYALSEEGRESWGIDLPYWFNDYDRGLLTEWVEEALAR